MADEIVTAGAPGSSETSVSSTPIETTAPETTGPAVSAETTSVTDPKQFLRDELSKVVLPGREATPEQKAAQEKVAADKTAADQKAAEEKAAADAKAAEGKTAEQKAADEKAAADKVAAEQKTVDPLDKLGPLPAEKLNEALTANPALVAELEKAGLDKDLLFETCRKAGETELYYEAGLPTPESAKFAVENANHFYDIEEHFPTAGVNLENFDNFMANVMVPLSIVRDANGQPIPDPKNPGQFKTDGSVSKFMERAVEYENQAISKNVCTAGIEAASKFITGKDDEGRPTFADAAQEEKYNYFSQLQAAVDFYEEFRKNGYRMPTSEKPAELSPEHKAEMERLRARDQEVTQNEVKVQQERQTVYTEQVATDTLKATSPFVEEILNGTSLTPELKTETGNAIWADLKAKMDGFRTYQEQKKAYYAQAFAKGATEEQQKKAFDSLVSLNARTMKNFLNGSNGIIAKNLKRFGGQQISAAEQRKQKVAAQVEADRMSSGARAAGSTNAKGVPSGAELDKAVMELARKNHEGSGEPTAAEIIRATFQIKQGAAA